MKSTPPTTPRKEYVVFNYLIIGDRVDNSLSACWSECSDIRQLSDFDDQSKSVNFDLSNGSPIDRNNFTILHYNINSILAPGKLEQLEDNCRLLNIGVLIITESKLDSTIPTNLLTIPGYHEPIRHDRQINGRYGWGVLMYIGNNLVFQHRQNLQYDLFEHIWADITVIFLSYIM